MSKKRSYADMYELVQHAGNVLPRLCVADLCCCHQPSLLHVLFMVNNRPQTVNRLYAVSGDAAAASEHCREDVQTLEVVLSSTCAAIGKSQWPRPRLGPQVLAVHGGVLLHQVQGGRRKGYPQGPGRNVQRGAHVKSIEVTVVCSAVRLQSRAASRPQTYRGKSAASLRCDIICPSSVQCLSNYCSNGPRLFASAASAQLRRICCAGAASDAGPLSAQLPVPSQQGPAAGHWLRV